ncbi:hypothetical protein COTS27_01040 [Spirochaetota bacterium]|nr:hypothetical protein COTS27_01040 [Spirochaetota bacterium]
MKTASTLIAEIKLRGHFPSEGDFLYKNDTEILMLLNAVLRNDLIPFYIENEPSYMLAYEDIPINGKRSFKIPAAAYNRRLYEVRFVTTDNDREENIPYMPFKNNSTIESTAEGMRIIGNYVELLGYGDRIDEYKLRLWYHRTSYDLVLDSETVLLKDSYTEAGKQQFSATERQFSFTEGARVMIQDSRDPFEITEDQVSFVRENGNFGLQRTEQAAPFRYPASAIMCPAKRLSIPEIPEVASELLILKTLLTMALSTETRYRVRDQLKQQSMLVEQSLKKRVHMETASKRSGSLLWS